MPAAIVLKNFTWSTPDGVTLFDNLDLAFGRGRTGLIGRNGVGKSTLLKLINGDLSPAGGSVTRHGRVGCLIQNGGFSRNDCLETVFGIAAQRTAQKAIESGQATHEAIEAADWTILPRFFAALAQVGLGHLSPDTSLDCLSGGQRTRVALAVLMFQEPDIVLLDEPTNNLDRDGRRAVASWLSRWCKPAIVASHDRRLLDSMDAIVELTTLGVSVYGGNWRHYCAWKAAERDADQQRLKTAERQIDALDRRQQRAVERKSRKDSAGKRQRRRGGAPKIALDAQKERAEESKAAESRLAQRMRTAAVAAAEEARARIEREKALSVTLAPTRLPKAKVVAEARSLCGGFDHRKPVVRDLDFRIVGPCRVGIVGPNGSGKTTLLRLMTGDLEPFSGRVGIFVRYAVLDQTMSLLDPALSVRDNFKALNPKADENTCRSALARLHFKADDALKPVSCLSGGQTVCAGLAAVLGGDDPPELLLLDEPTNHLDLDGVQALEAGLRAYDGALIVISHDEALLDAIGITRWVALPTG